MKKNGAPNNDLRPDARALAIVHKFFPKVERVKDARRNLMLEVTPSDALPRGRKKHDACAVAQACTRQLHLDGAIISLSRAYLVKDGVATRYTVVGSIAREITAFDRGAMFAPGRYTLYRIHPPHALGRAKSKTYGPKKTKRPRARHATQGIRAALA